MKKSIRFEKLNNRPVNMDSYVQPWPEAGFIAADSPYDPKPSLVITNGVITEMDGKARDEFDFIDSFIADHAIDLDIAEKAMSVDSLEIARMLVDISVTKTDIVKIAVGLTPAKICEVFRYLNVVEMMMAMQKMRERKTPSNQCHVTNQDDSPVQIAADAAECGIRGFDEEETTVGIARYAPLCALGLLVGSQIGRPGILTQCAVEEATELKMGMNALTTYAETISVYGTEGVFIDGDDTPYSKAFLASAYASRGMKMRCTSGSGSEVLMGNAEKKSMFYLEVRCIMVIKGAGVQGTQNGSVSCIGVTGSVPEGIREVLAENLVAATLGLEVASSNDQTFSHSDIRRTGRMLMQMLPGTDFIFSGYSATPNYDNMFAGSNFDAEDFDDYNVLQRDLKVDGGLRPVEEEYIVAKRREAATVMQKLFRELGFPEITDDEIEQVTYANGSKDISVKRDVNSDLKAAERLLNGEITGLDIAKALKRIGCDEAADSVFSMIKQRVSGDYLHTSSILDKEFNVMSSVNHSNDYMGPGTGYRVDGERWKEICNIPNAINASEL